MTAVKPPVGWVVDRSNSLATGLQRAYLCNEGSGTTIQDAMGSGAVGTFHGVNPTWATGAYGKPAVLIPGAAVGISYVSIPAIAGLVDPLTVVVGVTPTTVPTANAYYVDLNANTETIVSIGGSGAIRSYNGTFLDSTFVGQAGVPFVAVLSVSAGHVGTFNVNGSTATGGIGALTIPGTITLGQYGGLFQTANNGDAKIDFFYVWNRALSPTEAASIVSNPFSFFKAPTKLLYAAGQTVNKSLGISRGLVAAYLFNEATGVTIHDSSGFGRDGTVNNPGAWTTGLYGPAYTFVNGSPSTYVDCGTGLGTALGGSVTVLSVLTVFKRTSGSNDGLFCIGDFSASLGKFTQGVQSGEMYTSVDVNFSTFNPFNDTTTYHQALSTWDGATINQYIDGTPTTPTVFSTPQSMTGLKTILGAYFSTAYGWNGQIDSQFVWSRGLSTSEVAQLTANPFAMYGTSIPSMHFPGSLGSINGLQPCINGSFHNSTR